MTISALKKIETQWNRGEICAKLARKQALQIHRKTWLGDSCVKDAAIELYDRISLEESIASLKERSGENVIRF